MTYTGIVINKEVNLGSKNEKIAPFLVLDDGTELEMRKINQKELVDQELLSLDGKRIECEGITISGNLKWGELMVDSYIINELHAPSTALQEDSTH